MFTDNCRFLLVSMHHWNDKPDILKPHIKIFCRSKIVFEQGVDFRDRVIHIVRSYRLYIG